MTPAEAKVIVKRLPPQVESDAAEALDAGMLVKAVSIIRQGAGLDLVAAMTVAKALKIEYGIREFPEIQFERDQK